MNDREHFDNSTNLCVNLGCNFELCYMKEIQGYMYYVLIR